MKKVILHYNITGGEVQTIDQVVDEDFELEVTDESGNVTKIKAKDAKGTRATMPLDLDTLITDAQDQFDSHYVKMGYAWTQKLDPIKGRQIKLPKKEQELRDLFGLTDPKQASIWSHDYDNIDLVALSVETEKNKRSFIRGLFSAKARIRPGSKGYISYNWDYLGEELDDDTMDKFFDLFYDLTTANLEHNGSNIFFADRRQLYDYITKIGFVQKSKMESAIVSYRLHLRNVNNVIPVARDYLLYHVENFGEPNDYNDQMAVDYDVNSIHSKNGRTPLIITTSHAKHRSWYPVLWLLEHGADVNIKSKKDGTFEESFNNLLSAYYTKTKYIEELSKIIGYLYKDSTEYTKQIVDIMFCPHFNTRQIKQLFGLFMNGMSNIDPHSILSTIVGLQTQCGTIKSISIDIEDYDQHLVLMDRIIDSSQEDLNQIMDNLLDKILDVFQSGNYSRYQSRAYQDYVYFNELDLYISFFDSLKKRIQPNKNKLKLIQNVMTKEKILVYRHNKAEKHI